MPEKPGWQTTEFWLTLIATLGLAILQIGLFPEGSVELKITAAIVAALAALGYTAGRSYIKGKAGAGEKTGFGEKTEAVPPSRDAVPPSRDAVPSRDELEDYTQPIDDYHR